MEIWLDTANFSTLKQACARGHVTGVTSNPKILNEAGLTPEQFIGEVREFFEGPVALQAPHQDPSMTLDYAQLWHERFSEVFIKIPVIDSLLEPMHYLTQQGIHVMATTIVSVRQLHQAMLCGVEYAAPYVGHMAKYRCVQATMDDLISARAQYSTKLLAASISEVAWVDEMLMRGFDSVTLPEHTYEKWLMAPEQAQVCLRAFEEAMAQTKSEH